MTLSCYQAIVITWAWGDLLAHLEILPALSRHSTRLVVAALCAWISRAAPGDDKDRCRQVAAYLTEPAQRWLLDSASREETRLLIDHIGTLAVMWHPRLTRLLLRRSPS